MRTLIPLLQKVQIMTNSLIPTLTRPNRRKNNRHIKLSPSLLFDLEWRIPNDLFRAFAEGFVKVVGGLFVAGCCYFGAVGGVDEVDFDFPRAHGEAFHFLGLIAVGGVSLVRMWGGVRVTGELTEGLVVW